MQGGLPLRIAASKQILFTFFFLKSHMACPYKSKNQKKEQEEEVATGFSFGIRKFYLNENFRA